MDDRTKESTTATTTLVEAAAFKQFTQYFRKGGEGRDITEKKNQLIFYSSIREKERERENTVNFMELLWPIEWIDIDTNNKQDSIKYSDCVLLIFI